MKKFQKFRQKCIYRDVHRCSYWTENTQCHFLACPLFSPRLSDEKKQAIQKKMTDSVIFNVEDFDRVKTSIQDLINEVRGTNPIYSSYSSEKAQTAISVESPIHRMQCIACGEIITDDKFITIRDPSGVLIYVHSKGECDPRKATIPEIREKWLKSHTSDQ
ncbi:MAG: hypothetical protein ACFFAJ_17175 [Candidatus Hodarchaeota archaeon]